MVPRSFDRGVVDIFSSRTRRPSLACCRGRGRGTVTPVVAKGNTATIRGRVGRAFVRAVTRATLSTFRAMSSVTGGASSSSLVGGVDDGLGRVKSSLKAITTAIRSFSSVAGSTIAVLGAAARFLRRANSNAGADLGSLGGSSSKVSSLATTLSKAADAVSSTLTRGADFCATISSAVSGTLDSCGSSTRTTAGTLSSMDDHMRGIVSKCGRLSTTLSTVTSTSSSCPRVRGTVGKVGRRVRLTVRQRATLHSGVGNTTASVAATATGTAALGDRLSDLVDRTASSIGTIRAACRRGMGKGLSGLSGSLDSAANSISSVLKDLSDDVRGVTGIANSTSDKLAKLRATLAGSTTLLGRSSRGLATMTAGLSASSSRNVTTMAGLLSRSSRAVSSFLSSPIGLSRGGVCPVRGCKSTVAPFCSALTV